jgi:hypothetical protein
MLDLFNFPCKDTKKNENENENSEKFASSKKKL